MCDVDKIKRIMKQKKMCQRELAEATNLNVNTISRIIITGRASYESLKKISEVLECDVTELINQ